jgi:UDP-N-acetylmuramoylalanine--D-glutamate ligase
MVRLQRCAFDALRGDDRVSKTTAAIILFLSIPLAAGLAWTVGGMFQRFGSDVRGWLGGNFGEPLVEYLRLVKNGEKFDSVIAEVSSFQLEHCDRFTPQNIVFSNLAENHQDRYKSMEEYVNAKRRIFQNVNQATTSILNADDNAVVELARDPAVQRGRIFYFSRKPALEPQIMSIGGAVCIKDEIKVGW